MTTMTTTTTAPSVVGASSASFEELVAHEVQRAPGGSDRPVYLVNPLTDPDEHALAHRLNTQSSDGAFYMASAGAILATAATCAFADAGSLMGVLVSVLLGVGGCGGYKVVDRRLTRRRRTFDSAHPRARLVGPQWAVTAHERFTTAADTLQRLDISDEVRASLVEARRVMDDLLIAACDLRAAGVVDSPDGNRVYAQMRRHGAEARALITMARQREAILDGRSARDVLAASAEHSMAPAASQMQDENAHISALLDGTPRALGDSEH